MKIFQIALFLIVLLGGSSVANSDFCPRQFRANAASIVKDLHDYLGLFRTLAMLKLEAYSFGKHAMPILNSFFDTLPQYTKDCHSVSKGAKTGYSINLFLTDISSNFNSIVSFYDELQAKKPFDGKEDKCLSEHVIHFLVDNKDMAETFLSVMKVVNHAVRDEL